MLTFCILCEIPTLKNPLCEHCGERVRDEISANLGQRRLCAGHLTYPLFHWTRSSSPKMELLIYAMKQGAMPDLSRWCAVEFLKYWSEFYKIEEPLFVPAPPRKSAGRYRKDHAYYLAEELAHRCQGITLGGLVRQRRASQKGASREVRWGVKNALRPLSEALIQGLESRTVVFCDDVVTTGATLRAAYRALHKPRRFLVATLAYRERRYASSSKCP